MVKEQFPEAAKTVAAEILPRWLNNLQALVEPGPIHHIDKERGFGQAQGEEFALQAQAWAVSDTKAEET